MGCLFMKMQYATLHAREAVIFASTQLLLATLVKMYKQVTKIMGIRDFGHKFS